MSNSKDNRGGPRHGSGRPKKGRKQLVVWLDSDCAEAVEKQTDFKAKSDYVNAAIRHFASSHKNKGTD